MFIALALTLAAPVPKGTGAELYLPVTEGARRVMRARLGEQTSRVVSVVTRVESAGAGGGHRVTIASSRGGGAATETAYRVSGEGIARLTSDGVACEPVTLLRLPVRDGDTWTSEEPAAGGAAIRTTYTAGKAEVIAVPAGRFTAVPVTAIAEYPTGTRKTLRTWYAVGVGVVRSTTEYNDSPLKLTQELMVFTTGK